ncbi:Mitogen-activated protein kinase 5 MPK5 [Gracilaria domingensis]|nr:Mitogen-activated protein kinase 5 MPK5 [Gracilaria domingensis]
MHRDLKPANILIQESCDLSICDFGLARYVEEVDEGQQGMTEYVVTRWYRAPELVLTNEYSNAVDLWAVGCIMGDLLGRKVLFPGKDFKHQVEIICEILGKPSEEDIKHVTSSRARKFLSKLPESAGVDFSNLFPNANPHAIDLMERLLKFNPDKRLTAEEALEHPYLKEFHDPEFELVATDQIDMSQIEPRVEGGRSLSKDDLRRMMLEEIYHFRPDADIFKNNPGLMPK